MAKMRKKQSTSLLCSTFLIIYLVFAVIPFGNFYAYASDYHDIKGHWAENYLNDLIEKSYIKGINIKGQLIVQPNRYITRAEFLAILMRTDDYKVNTDEKIKFSDVNEKDWFCESVDIAASNDITGGYPDGTFKPNNHISRAEIASLIARIGQFELKEDSSIDLFKDIKSSKWYYKSIIMAKQYGIIGGYPDGSFRPEGKATRAEVAAMISKYIKLSDGSESLSATPITSLSSTPTPASRTTSMPTSRLPGSEPEVTLPPELIDDTVGDIPKIYSFDVNSLDRSEIMYRINYIKLTDLGKFSAKITFDPTKLEVLDVYEGTAKSSRYIAVNGDIDLSNSANGVITVTSEDDSEIAAADGILFIVKFRVLPGASGTTDIKISGISLDKPELYKSNGDRITDIEVKNGSITF